ncbi:hypothetical protein C8R44DRAFT_544667, partial [Mycena epipterygia]
SLEHPSALCDRYIHGIQGLWLRCTYCVMEFCDTWEAVATHNDLHICMIFKSPVSFT